ncbi:enolase C-terminal domain-like protein [Mycolicibacterium grossiae]|uniref:O-succinylbenzoate synthase n=1 Tax=Mycolicibacterium grossiae TaxID=1552759 RepID=A0A1E8Q3D2_9MYCO|nr:enolase C-terminal domain-like protein [Mycolicibacterium grossiae]OFJ53092.1 O-succinylbenzoate synthase [Mycolicibacterium grossiae]QEM46853.1 O-succinylbenzoate synthase [Mycolicibacterium grossiae]
MRTLIDFDRAVPFAVPYAPESGETGAREGLLVEGPQGWGEFSPFDADPPERLARWLTAAAEPGTVGWPEAVRGRVAVAASIGALPPARAAEVAEASGCHTAEVTVGRGLIEDDAARVAAVREALGPDGVVRVRADGAWDVEAAVRAITEFAAQGAVQYVEAPCRTLAETAAVRRRVDVPVAVRLDDAAGVAGLREAADVVVLLTGPLGGVRRALRVAESVELPCTVSSSVETSVGLAAGLAVAGALPDLPFACALGTRTWLAGDVVGAARVLLPTDGVLPVAPMPAAPDPAASSRFAITDPDRIAWWRSRLRSAADVAGGIARISG